MRLGLLGPLEVETGSGGRAAITAAQQRAVLACLALRANRAVSAAQLAETLWADRPPPSAKAAVLNYVARLRRNLGEAADRVQTTATGYRLEIRADGELDHLHAAALHQQGRQAVRAGDWPAAERLAAEALGLWRGEPLEDVPCDRLRADCVPALETLRFRLEEVRLDAQLAGGRFDSALPRLIELASAHPLDENLQERRLVALYCAGRRADALDSYRQARSVLCEAIGAEPSARLRELHQLALQEASSTALVNAWMRRSEAAQTTTIGTVRSAGPATRAQARAQESSRAPQSPTNATQPPPATADARRGSQLPRRPRLLVGRESELKALTCLLVEDCDPDSACRVGVLAGPAGVGKTTLALSWAHAVAADFPDGQMYLDLCGFAADAAPLSADAAIRALLDFLGVPVDRFPATPEGRAARYRQTVADRRVLIVFDNARDAAQVRPLLPAGDACRALVTSRRSLAGLVALDDAEQVALAPLPADASRELLVRRLGAQRVSGQEGAIEAIAERCAHLPLALSVAAARAASMTAVPLGALADQLAVAALNALEAGDDASNVRSVLSWSYLRLAEPAARLFRFLGLHPGPEITAPAAAALSGEALSVALPLVGELAAMNLLTETAPGRYTMHSLLRAFAAELVENQAGPECAAARHRLFDYYLRWAVDADHSFTTLPRQIDADLVELPAGLEPPGFPENADSGMKWLRAERDVVMALTAHAAAEGWDSYAWRLASAQACALLLSNRAHDCARQSRIGLSAAKRLGDLLGQAHSHHQIGRALIYTRERETARFQLRRALRLYRGLGHLPGLTETYRDLRTLYATEGEYEAALPYGLEYVALAEQLGHLPSQTMAHTALAEVLVSLGRIAEAQEHGRRAIDMSRSLGRLRSEAAAQQVMGEVYRILGDEAASAASYERARELYDRLGYVDQLRGLVSQAEVSESRGELDRARQIWTMVRLQAGGDSYYVDEAVRKIAELGVGSVR